MKAFLEYRDDKSQKFWEIQTEGKTHTVRFGRIGTNGQTKTKTFPSPAAAEADAKSLAAKKRKKGYVDRSAAPAPEADTDATELEPPAAGPGALGAYAERIDAAERAIREEIYKDASIERLNAALAYIRGESEQAAPAFVTEQDFTPLSSIFAPLPQWTGVDERVLECMATKWIRRDREYEWGFHECFYEWLAPQIASESSSPVYPLAVQKMTAFGIDDEAILRHTISELADVLVDADEGPTSAGRYLLDRYPAEQDAMLQVGKGKRYGTRLCSLLARHAPDAFDAQLPSWWGAEKEWGRFQLARALLAVDHERYGTEAEKCLDGLKEPWPRFQVASALFDREPDRFRTRVREIAEQNLAHIQKVRNSDARHSDAAWDSSAQRFIHMTPTLIEFLLERFGSDAKQAVFDYVEGTKALDLGNLEIAVKHLGQEAMPIVSEGFGVPIEDKEDVKYLSRFLRILNHVDWSDHHDDIWKLVQHKSKPVREAAAVGMGGVGAAAVPRAKSLLAAKKADHRHGGAIVLSVIGDEESIAALEGLVDTEKNDDVRDFALGALDVIWQKSGRELDDGDLEKRFGHARSKGKLDKPVREWLDEAKLPPLHRSGEKDPMSQEWVRWVLYRQGRASGAEVDVELRPLLARVDRSRSGAFAAALWKSYLESGASAKDKLCITLAGALGDETLVDSMVAEVDDWARAGRGKLAEIGVRALARVGADSALRAIDEYRRAPKGVAKNVVEMAEEAFVDAADALGITPAELSDRVIPDLGFEGLTRTVDVGGAEHTVRIGPDFELVYVAPDGKTAKSLPKGATKDLKAEYKSLAKSLRVIAKAQRERLEADMVLQRRWTPPQLGELFLNKAVRKPFAVGAVWGRYDVDGGLVGTFRALEDGSLADLADEEVALGEGDRVGLVHPLELGEDARATWAKHFEDYKIIPLLAQLHRPVVRCPAARIAHTFYDDLKEKKINGTTFRGRAERNGWRRGSVIDAGGISAYHKVFATAGVDVILRLDGLHIVAGPYDEVELGRVSFARAGTVEYGNYTYDEPRAEDDERLFTLGDVPPIVYSEAMVELSKIAGVE